MAPERPAMRGGTTVWVGRVKSTVPPNLLQDAFEKVGKVVRVETGFGGFAFVQFDTEEDAEKSCKQMNKAVVPNVGEIRVAKATVRGYEEACAKREEYWRSRGGTGHLSIGPNGSREAGQRRRSRSGERSGGGGSRSDSRSRSRRRERYHSRSGSRSKSRSRSGSPRSVSRDGRRPSRSGSPRDGPEDAQDGRRPPSRDRRSCSRRDSRERADDPRGDRRDSRDDQRLASPPPLDPRDRPADPRDDKEPPSRTRRPSPPGEMVPCAGDDRVVPMEDDRDRSEGIQQLSGSDRAEVVCFFDGASASDLLLEGAAVLRVPDYFVPNVLSGLPYGFQGLSQEGAMHLMGVMAAFASSGERAAEGSVEVRQALIVDASGRRLMRKSIVIDGTIYSSEERTLST